MPETIIEATIFPNVKDCQSYEGLAGVNAVSIRILSQWQQLLIIIHFVNSYKNGAFHSMSEGTEASWSGQAGMAAHHFFSDHVNLANPVRLGPTNLRSH